MTDDLVEPVAFVTSEALRQMRESKGGFTPHIFTTNAAEADKDGKPLVPLYPESSILKLQGDVAEARALNNKYAWERDKAREERDAAERKSEAFWKPRLEAAEAEVARMRTALAAANVPPLDMWEAVDAAKKET